MQRDYNLKSFNTFGIEAKTKALVWVGNEAELLTVLESKEYRDGPKMILGGGSNLLFTGDYPGVILKSDFQGMEILDEDHDEVLLEVGAGVVWHHLVMHCVNRNWGGIENLSLIPGQVGAAPIQNIGAYGVELKEVFDHLEAYDLETGEKKLFNKEACAFGYRDSVFKRKFKGKYFISKVVIRLQKYPYLNTSYGAIEEELKQLRDREPTIRDVSEAVIRIRQSKLPDPSKIGNSGSFFKNPVVDRKTFEKLRKKHPKVPHYPQENDHVKLPAGWLIEQAGWKGKKFGNYGVHDRQALVLVNFGGAKGKDIYELSEKILQSVKKDFGIQLEREVNII